MILDPLASNGCRNAQRFLVMTLCALTFAGCSSTNASVPLPSSTAGTASTLDTLPLSSGTGYRVLFSFGRKADGVDGIYPFAGLIDVGAKLYGTTAYGGRSGYGTVFRISRTGKQKVLHDFKGTDGSYPDAALLAVGDILYGTTLYGGANGDGAVFAIGANGSGFRVLYSFAGGSDGADPMAGLIDVDGTLYGTTYQGGAYSDGTAFSVSTSGAENVLHSFSGTPDGEYPAAGLIDVGGVLYGTTEGGGRGAGTVFSLTTGGSESVLYRFGSEPDGHDPVDALIAVNGLLYGTTYSGGSGSGIVFSVSTSGTETVLHVFGGGSSDGTEPMASLADLKGTLYGTTYEGGTAGYGTVFSITTSGTETVLHSFGENYANDGAYPTAGLLAVKGTLYGTTYNGGVSEPSCYSGYGDCYWGTVFALTP
jgi:uncharacterized repeat protein (TIGR03803 family)